MIKIVIDGAKIKSVNEFHNEVIKLFEFPEYYGGNFSAFRDCFKDWTTNHIEEEIIIVWKDHKDSTNVLGQSFIDKIEEIVLDTKSEISLNITFDLR